MSLGGQDFKRVFDILQYQKHKYPQEKSLSSSEKSQWKSFSTHDIIETVDRISSWLIDQGFQKGDCVGLIPKMGNAKWMIIDFACQQLGMILVPIHPTSQPNEIKFILDETKCKICFVVDAIHYIKTKEVFTSMLFHLEVGQEGFFKILGGQNTKLNPELDHRKACVDESDTLAIMYTSGTSGTPKGAILSHQNVVSNIKSLLPLFEIRTGDNILSFLPFSHIFERTSCYAYLAFGANIYFSEKLENVAQDFKSVRPSFCTCVPKTLERMYEILEEQRQQKSAVKKFLVRWAMNVGEQFRSDKRQGLSFYFKLVLARIFILNQWRNALGGKMKCMVVGAAALRPEIGRLFSAAGVLTLSGYGMTEASPFIAVNRPEPGLNKFGTVGLPGPGVEIKLDEVNEKGEGEVLVKGPNIMKGYFNRPELNAQVFTPDGWFKTGDVGKMVDGRFLTITDRKKDIFKTSSGIYIAPQPLENHFCSSSFISHCLILGFNKPFVTAIIVPHFNLLKNWCEEMSIHWTSPQFMVHNIKVIQKMQLEVTQLNESLQNYQRVQKFVLSEADWTVEGGELTTSFKMIRTKLLEKHKEEIEKLY